MKKLLVLLSMFCSLAVLSFAACKGDASKSHFTSNGNSTSNVNAETTKNGKILIVFFSRKGQNQPNPKGSPLKVGNTARIAEDIADVTDGTLFEIVPVKNYPEDYQQTLDITKKEKKENSRPAIKNKLKNIDEYSIIFIGYPIWWGTTPMIVHTFFDSYNLKGKTIIPFCTHHGSGLGSSVEDIHNVLPSAQVRKGLAIWDNQLDKAKPIIADWLKELDVQ